LIFIWHGACWSLANQPGFLAGIKEREDTAMTPAAESVNPWRATVERHQVPAGASRAGAAWQLLMADVAFRQGPSPAAGAIDTGNGWRARVERFDSPAPAGVEVPTFEVVPSRGDTLIADAALAAATAKETPPAKPAPVAAPKDKEFRLFSEEGVTLADFIDVINPLQHIPVVSSIYRHATGDELNIVPRVLGGALFFGPIGAAVAVVNAIVEGITGKDAGEHVIAFLEKNSEPENKYFVERDQPRMPQPWDQPPTAVAAKPDAPPRKERAPQAPSRDAEAAEVPPATLAPALAALLPEGATPIRGRRVDFAQAALRPAAFAPHAAIVPVAAAPLAEPTAGAEENKQDEPAGGGAAYARLLDQRRHNDAWTAAKAYQRPDLMAGLVAKRSPAQTAGQIAAQPAPAGATAAEGGWFSDAMLSALAKYQESAKRGQAPEPANVDVVH
jgi:hypothetical protein